MKKFLAILLAAMMLLATAGVAFASEVTNDHTITAPDNGHTYEIFQIFTGEYSAETVGENTITKLSNTKWGTNGAGTVGADVDAEVLKNLAAVNTKSDAEKLAVIKQQVNFGTTDAPATPFAIIGKSGTGLSASVPAGYYLIRDKADTIPGLDSATLYIVEVAANVTIAPKADKVQFDKKIKDVNDSLASTVEGAVSDWQDSADYDIGDDVPFKISFTLGDDYDNYTQYYLCMSDEMENTLKFNNDVVVKVDDKIIETGFEVKPDGDQKFEVVFADLREIADVKAGSVITAEYTAELLSTANIGEQGNMNKAMATFSNNPQVVDDKGTTDYDAVIAFTYKVVVNKENSTGDALKGAEFKLEKFDADAEEDKQWVLVPVDGTVDENTTTFTFKGLDDGIYKLTETKTPTGFNTCEPMTFVVSGEHTAVVDLDSFDMNDIRKGVLTEISGNKQVGEIELTPTKADGTLTTDVVNYSGAQLPSTGGIGTTLFYMFGGIMAAGSALMLVVRRRADAEEE